MTDMSHQEGTKTEHWTATCNILIKGTQHCSILHYTTLHNALNVNTVHCMDLTALHCTALYWTGLDWTALHCTALNCSILPQSCGTRLTRWILWTMKIGCLEGAGGSVIMFSLLIKGNGLFKWPNRVWYKQWRIPQGCLDNQTVL